MNRQLELPYFSISGEYGGNQDWMLDFWMKLGGCGAITFCDVLIYTALHRSREDYYPFDIESLSRRDYRKFAMIVKPYLRPRATGIKDIETFIEGARDYLDDNNIADIDMSGIQGYEPFEIASKVLIDNIDNGMPVGYLMLNHSDRKFDFFQWHWFIINGYKYVDDKLYIKAATYGRAHWLCMNELWNTGYEEKGGLVLFNLRSL